MRLTAFKATKYGLVPCEYGALLVGWEGSEVRVCVWRRVVEGLMETCTVY